MNASQLTLATAVVLAAGLLGCAPFPVEGRYSYATTTDFSKLKSFALEDLADDVFSTPESTAHFRKVMVSGLSAKGLAENPENPDFMVHVAPVHTYREIYAHHGNFEIPKAMLRVNFRRSSGDVDLFEGAAHAYFHPSWTQKEKNAVIDEAVRVILAGFPLDK